jgi:hypothetical protein
MLREARQQHRLLGDKRRSLAVDDEGGHPLDAGLSIYHRARARVTVRRLIFKLFFIPAKIFYGFRNSLILSFLYHLYD